MKTQGSSGIPRHLTLTYALITFLYIAIGLIAYYGVQYARDLRSRAIITEELVSEMRVLTRSDMMNQDGVQRDIPSVPESWLGTGKNVRSSYLGLRFTGLAIPAEATVVSAKMEVVSSQEQTVKLKAEVYGERNATPEEFSLQRPPSRRQPTRTRLQLLDESRWQPNVTYAFDVTAVIQELYERVKPTDKIVLIIEGRGERNQKRYLFNGLSGDQAPKLFITYTLPATVTPTPVVDETIIDVLLAPLRVKPPTPTPSPQPTPTVNPTATPTPYVKPSPTPCPYPPDDPRCGASDQPTSTPNPSTPIPKSPITPTPCPYPPDDPRCGY